MTENDLKKFSLLAEFSSADCEVIAELLEPRSLARGRRLFGEGVESDGLVLVSSGSMRLESNRRSEPETLGEGSALGALSLVSPGTREATVSADTDCELLILPRTSFRRLVEDHPRTACRLLECLVADLAGLIRPGLDKLAR